MKKLLIVIGLLLGVSTLDVLSASAAGFEQINRYDSQIRVSRDNRVSITETIVYDFGSTYQHGIYRDVPIDYRDGNTAYYINFKLIGVWDEDNKDLETKLTTESGNKRIRIGDPDKTITGEHTYKISYELYPLIIDKAGKPFLNLDIVGGGWQVPINNISAKITLDTGASLDKIQWYGADNLSAQQSSLIALRVPAYTGVTINAELPEGYVTQYLEPNKPRTEDVIAAIVSIAVGVLVGLIVIGLITIAIARAVRSHRRRKSQIVVAQYEPPTGLSPAHIGLLQDDVSDNREITATVIDWAVRGYIKIAYIPKKGIFGSKDYQLVRLNESKGLAPIEQPLFNAFFTGSNQVLLSQLDKGAVATQVTKFKVALKTELTDRGYYDKEGNLLMRGTITEAGAKVWALVDGFKLYLSVVEKDRLKFSDAPEKTPERFSKLLPYAIALGVEKEWAKQFEGIDLTEATDWYRGNLATFSAVALASDLGSSFAGTVSSNSSVSSSGGSSGGGFGGGGGGSW